jgi:hypothetical protein
MTAPVVQFHGEFNQVRHPRPALGGDSAVYAHAAQVAGFGQSVTLDATGYASLASDAIPNQIAGGVANDSETSDTGTTDGGARIMVSWGTCEGRVGSTAAGDAFTIADMAVPFWYATAAQAGSTCPGKLSHTGTLAGANLVNRSCGGLELGPDPRSPIGGTFVPRVWEGPVAQAVARGVMVAQAWGHAGTGVNDAAASTTTAEKAIRRPKVHGTTLDVTFTGAAVTASNTDYAIITISKRDGAGGGATVVATYDTRITGQGTVTAFTPALFLLSVVAGALDWLETDIATLTITKGGAGQQLIGEILVNGKVI